MSCVYCGQARSEQIQCTVCKSVVCTTCARTGSIEYICPGCLFAMDDGRLNIIRQSDQKLPIARKETICHLCSAPIVERSQCVVLNHCKKHKLCDACYSNQHVTLASDLPCPGAILAAAEPLTLTERAVGAQITPELLTSLMAPPAASSPSKLHNSMALNAAMEFTKVGPRYDKEVDANLFMPLSNLEQLTDICNKVDGLKSKQTSGVKKIKVPDPKNWKDTTAIHYTMQAMDLTRQLTVFKGQRDRVYYTNGMAGLASPEDENLLPKDFSHEMHRERMQECPPLESNTYVKCIKLGAPPQSLSMLLQPDTPSAPELADIVNIPVNPDIQLPVEPCIVSLRQKR